jgi:hypothetical protein
LVAELYPLTSFKTRKKQKPRKECDSKLLKKIKPETISKEISIKYLEPEKSKIL